MEEKAKKAVTDEELDDELDNDEDLEDEDIDDDDVSDDDIEEDEDDDDENPSDSKSQEDEEKEKEKAKNARFAEMRRKKEAEEKAKKEAEQREQKIRDEATIQGKLSMMKTNPYTDEPIEDEEDLKIYEIQKELDDEGKDPIADLPKRLAQLRREELRKAKTEKEEKEKAEKAQSDKITAEIAELVKKYPKLNTAQLADDPLYQECMKGRAGRWTQVEIYEFYLEKKKAAEEKEKADKEKKIVDENASKISKTPSSKATGATVSKDVADMSREEFEAYFQNKYHS